MVIKLSDYVSSNCYCIIFLFLGIWLLEELIKLKKKGNIRVYLLIKGYTETVISIW